MKKQTIEKFGTHYLLGINRDNEKVWLEDFSWDCGWYWGGGYLHTFTNNRQPTRSRDISSHYHFDSFSKDNNLFDGFKEHFVSSTLSDKELWHLCDLMAYFYSLRKSAECLKHGGGQYSKVDGMPEHTDLQTELNKIIETEIIPQVHKLFEL